MIKLKHVGDEIPPYRTPFSTLNDLDVSLFRISELVSLEYISASIAMVSHSIWKFLIVSYSFCLFTESKAFRRSMSQQ